MFSGQQSAFGRLVLALEVVTDVLHLHPLHPWLPADILDDPFQHENHVRVTSDVRVYRDGKAEIVFLSVKEVKVIPPEIFYIAWVHPTMGIRRLLDEHHRWEIVEVPVCRDFDESCLLAVLEGMHPMRRMLRIVNLGPTVAGPEPVGVAVLVREGVI